MAFWDLLFCFLTLSSRLQTALSGPLQTGIHGGTNASPTEFPYVVSILSNNTHLCGGSILTKKFVLSAAHCFGRHFVLNSYNVIAGEYNKASIEGHEQVREVKGITNHPGYRKIVRSGEEEFRNDITILELKTNINLNERVQTIQLPERRQSFTGNGILCGWGDTSEDGPTPNILQKADLKILSDQECRKTYSRIRKKDLCAEGNGQSKVACGGDSGSPLAQNVLIGVVSNSRNCTFAIPTVFTEVSFYVKWINENIS